MELKQALKVLNLKENYTEQELKEAHRKLILKHHPDKNPNNPYALQKTQQINEAREVLKNHLNKRQTPRQNTNDKNNSQNKNNQIPEIINILKKIKEELDEINSIENDDLIFMRHKQKMVNIIFNFSNNIIQINNNLEEKFKKEYQNFKSKYQKALIEYYIDFSKTTCIDNNLWTIHYCDTFKEVRKCMFISIHDELNNELHKYFNHKYYKNLLPLLNKLKHPFVIDCLYGNKDIYTTQIQFNNRIVLELKKYEKRRRLIDELKTDKIISILPIIIELEYAILDEEKFYNLYSQINLTTKIKCKIKKHLKKKSN